MSDTLSDLGNLCTIGGAVIAVTACAVAWGRKILRARRIAKARLLKDASLDAAE